MLQILYVLLDSQSWGKYLVMWCSWTWKSFSRNMSIKTKGHVTRRLEKSRCLNLSSEWGLILPPCWFSLNNSEIVKALTVTLGSIQHSADNCTIFAIPNSFQSPDIGQNLDSGISDFWSVPYKPKIVLLQNK